jgi:DNA polymerase III sliding clamp (beta) subunit (PCNA family)
VLNDLKFAAGAIAKKDFVPSLTHFRIADGRIYGFNGVLSISTPTDLAVSCVPKAASLIKAMEKVDDGVEIVLNLTQGGRLSVKAGKFRAYVDCIEDTDSVPQVEPAGQIIELPTGLLSVLNVLQPFVSVDASRPWSRGILLRGQSAFATNNIVVVEHWMPYVFPADINIPAEAVKEIIRIGMEPVSLQLEDRAVTFHYATGAWIRTSLGAIEWPDLNRVLDRPAEPKPFHPEFFESVRRLDAFTDKTNRLYLRGGTLATSSEEGVGACVDLEDFGGIGCYYLKQMAALDGVADVIDWSAYPGPCLFYGNMLRGAIVGMKTEDTP